MTARDCPLQLGVLKQILAHKLVFIETTDVLETTLALENFKRAVRRRRQPCSPTVNSPSHDRHMTVA